MQDYTHTTENTFVIPAGEYYIGDLCYALNETLYDKVFGGYGYRDGVYRRKDASLLFAVAGTGGDGEFKATNGWKFPVDAGIIGVASKKLCDKEDNGGGHYVTLTSPTTCHFNRGGIRMQAADYSFHLDIPFEEWDEEEENEDEWD